MCSIVCSFMSLAGRVNHHDYFVNYFIENKTQDLHQQKVLDWAFAPYHTIGPKEDSRIAMKYKHDTFNACLSVENV